MRIAPTVDFLNIVSCGLIYLQLQITYTLLRSKLHTKIRIVEDQGEENVYWLTQWNRVLPEMRTDSQLVKKFLQYYGTRSFITAFSSAPTRPYQFSPCFPIAHFEDTFQYYLPIYARISQVVSFPQASSPYMYFSCLPFVPHVPPHLIIHELIIRKTFGDEYRSLSSLLCSFLHFLLKVYC
jgi:hypothetical protein